MCWWQHSIHGLTATCPCTCRGMTGYRIPSLPLLLPSDSFTVDGCFHCLWASVFERPGCCQSCCEPIVPDIQCEPPRMLRMVLPSVHFLKRWSLCLYTNTNFSISQPSFATSGKHLLNSGSTLAMCIKQKRNKYVAWVDLNAARPQPN